MGVSHTLKLHQVKCTLFLAQWQWSWARGQGRCREAAWSSFSHLEFQEPLARDSSVQGSNPRQVADNGGVFRPEIELEEGGWCLLRA